MALLLKIVSPEKVAFEGEVESVIVPGTVGKFEILEHHAPIISSLEKGAVTYTTKDGTTDLDILGGFVLVKKDEVNLCVELNK